MRASRASRGEVRRAEGTTTSVLRPATSLFILTLSIARLMRVAKRAFGQSQSEVKRNRRCPSFRRARISSNDNNDCVSIIHISSCRSKDSLFLARRSDMRSLMTLSRVNLRSVLCGRTSIYFLYIFKMK